MTGWWPKVRAAFVAFHLVAVTLSALPSPEGGMSRQNWADPTVQAEFAAWAGRVGMAPKVFEERLWVLANAYNTGYREALAPVRPYEDLTGTEQSWKMFVAPHRFPTRLEIAARAADGEWEVLFEESSPTATWNRAILRHERLRSAIFRWGWPNYAGAYGKGCAAIAGLAFAERPALTEVRCRFWKAESPSPEEALRGERPEGKWTSQRIARRGADGKISVATTPATPKGAAAAGTSAP